MDLTSARGRRMLAELRLVAQGVIDRPFARPVDAARHLVCAQGQHVPGVLAALALRARRPTIDDVFADFAAGRLVRSYPMRQTVFAVAAEDVAWLTDLTGPRQLRAAATRRDEHGLTRTDLDRAADTIRSFLADVPGHTASRDELAATLEASGLDLTSGRRYHVIFTLMAAGVLVYGPFRGRDHLIVDAATWLPAGNGLAERFGGDETAAVAHWLRRYLLGHGPATVRDFAWWTKLPLGVIRAAAPAATGGLEVYGQDAGEDLWGPPGLIERRAALGASVSRALLLPAFDEIVLGYPNRELIVASEHHPLLAPGNNGIFRATVHRAGQIVGTWSRTGSVKRRSLTVAPFAPLSATAEREIARAEASYPAEVSYSAG
ncbi:winged helix DNA-binding domain-containing protein [Nigerium massiliense]|uniref:winged helix DNA-binding domain-containing protein n=1 Tax=Nigerium massiliense TaxID=1522317 RepID=UPI000693C86C|nr:winged helix DNA-binding domain-containing protein [Nigerium massiliense]